MVSPIALAAAATALPNDVDGGFWNVVVATCTVLAGVATAIYKALDLDVSLDLLAKQANQFKILQDRFRQASRVSALLDDQADFQAEFDTRMGEMDALRLSSLPPPERFFKRAQAKVRSGDYAFGIDNKLGRSVED